MYEFKTIFKRKYRFVALFLSCFLCFGTVSSQYLTVQAFDWTAPSVYLPFDGAIPYLMGLLGVAPKDGALFTEDDYKSYLLENGYTEEDLENNGRYAQWVQDISEGKLNQASEYWSKFKSWVKSKFSSVVTGYPINFETAVLNINNVYGTNFKLDGSWNNLNIKYFVLDISNDYLYAIDTDADISIFSKNDSVYIARDVNRNYRFSYYRLVNNDLSSNSSISNYSIDLNSTCILSNNILNFDLYNFSALFSTNSEFVVYNQNIIDNLSFALSDAISTAIPDVIPLPWDQIGDTVDDIKDYIDGLLEQVQAGVIDISDYMRILLDKIGALALDVATGLLYPTNPDRPDETLDDKANENKGNLGFTLFGLEKVFPFCIPFDIYAFLTLLVAEPVAPVINWPVYNPVTHNNEIITIDFSKWNSVVVLFRYIFDFLFIIGMLLMARALIGGGDSA